MHVLLRGLDRVPEAGGEADAGAAAHRQAEVIGAGGLAAVEGGHRLGDAAVHLVGLGAGGTRHDQCEFVAAGADHHVPGAGAALNQPRGFNDEPVALLKAEEVVDQVEAVDVAHGHRERQVLRVVEELADALIVAPVVEAGHLIVLAHVEKPRLVVLLAGDVDDDAFQCGHLIIHIDALTQFQHPFALAGPGDDLVLIAEVFPRGQDAPPLVPEEAVVFGGDQVVEAEFFVAEQALRGVAGQRQAALRHKFHRPVRVVPAAVRKARQVRKQHRLGAFALPLRVLGLPSGGDVLDQRQRILFLGAAAHPDDLGVDPDRVAAGADVPLFHREAVDFTGLKLPVVFRRVLEILGVGDVLKGQRRKVLPGAADDAQKHLVDAVSAHRADIHLAARRADHDADGRLIYHGPEEFLVFGQPFAHPAQAHPLKDRPA